MSASRHDLNHFDSSFDLKAPLAALLPQLEAIDTAVMLTHLPRLYARLRHLDAVFGSRVQHSIAIKSQPEIELLKVISERGFGLEAASIEEVRRALAAGCPPQRLVFDSPVKTRRELNEVSQLQGLLVNVNSLDELNRIPSNTQCTIGIRINPQIHTGSPELFSVGRNESKFGVPLSNHQEITQAVLSHPVRALHMHSGSQIRDLKAQREALKRLGLFAHQLNHALNRAGIDRRIELIDIGGGLPTEPLTEQSNMKAYATLVYEVEELRDFKLVTEFGQWVNAECGLALSRIEYVVSGDPDKIFIHLGADMFTRDAYTKARSFPLSLWGRDGHLIQGEEAVYDIAGPLCFAGDYLAKSAKLAVAKEGQWLCIDHTGANTYALWSRHCSRDIPASWAWDGEKLINWSPRRAIEY